MKTFLITVAAGVTATVLSELIKQELARRNVQA